VIPKLNVTGLSFSDIVPDQKPAEIEETKKQDPLPPPPATKPAFSIPKLKIQGLGLSDLIPDTQPVPPV